MAEAAAAAAEEEDALEVVAVPRSLVAAHVHDALLRTYVAHREVRRGARGGWDIPPGGDFLELTRLRATARGGAPLRDPARH